ncbi:MAG: hypothetical protein E6713_15175 [Sporomusaceae bacterium]|nr:hypothetical protein [Sporomusaceae bacterium]
MNVTAFVLGMIVTLGYYFCVVRKEQKKMLAQLREEMEHSSLADGSDSKK